jgi:hypothetical protein
VRGANEDLSRLHHSNPHKYRAMARLMPNGSLGVSGASSRDLTGGRASGIENALQPIALVPLRPETRKLLCGRHQTAASLDRRPIAAARSALPKPAETARNS